MKVLLANPRGFCAGVDMAIETVDQALALGLSPIYVYHEIVHNRHVVDRFRKRGVVFVESMDEVPPEATVIFSAHGVSPEIRRRARDRGCTLIDATCPLVTKVHMEAIRYARQGYHILLVGHTGHDEVVGTVGEAPQAITVVGSLEEVEHLPFTRGDRLAYLTQTTLSMDDAQVIIEALRKRYPDLKDPPSDDICYATTNRQHAVRQLAPEADLVLVIGSRNSSNSCRLVEIAQNSGTPARLVDDVHGLEPTWFEGMGVVLVTAGASAPEHLVQELIAFLEREYEAVCETRQTTKEDMYFNLPQSL
ncbi:MAG: 4-hydroxy-3-methylbut-2-enyl diphosphate reductase, partial [Phycisphaerae bacterium]|nr:4-hydroxy-3-methylbut-2-enyl diphosphate reductase [Phycisphaerae bacterium]